MPGDDGSWDLVRAVQAGDVATFGRIYQRYQPALLGYFRGRQFDPATAEDLTSETFVRALQAIHQVSDRGRDLAAWLLTIARNLALDHRRSGRVRREMPTSELPEWGAAPVDGPEKRVLAAIELDEAARRIALLTVEQRQCLLLRRVHGLSVTETAAAMRRSETAVRALHHRAGRQLSALATS
ncbi:RNA polymerase sigma factor [Amycolatopsis methanolica]|uniref:RNA polymerase sigma factor n=1 Tax=Amycolatopsis methanolica TaxID=1814 RepID=UPI00342689F0